MNWAQLRATCLRPTGAAETFPFGPDAAVFKAPNRKMFAVSVISAEPLDISLKCDPDRAVELRQDYAAIAQGYHLNKRHWITITLNSDVPDALVRALIQDSYDLVTARGPARSELKQVSTGELGPDRHAAR
jgi:predicted DNA-binding protein (MmcQ/YjbR family)